MRSNNEKGNRINSPDLGNSSRPGCRATIKFTSLLLLAIIFFIGTASAQSYYVKDPTDCPSLDESSFPGQSCTPEDICGNAGGNVVCYDTSLISIPSTSSTTISY